MSGISGFRRVSGVLGIMTPILGSVRKDDTSFILHRDPEGSLILMPGWWNKVLDFGAKAIGKYQSIVRQARFDPVVHGELATVTRDQDGISYKHEAIVTYMLVNFCIPADIVIDAFKYVLENGGRYVGMAPQEWAHGYGRFRVIDLREEDFNWDGAG